MDRFRPHAQPSPAVDPLGRVLAFMRASFVRSADATRPIEAGVVLSTPSMPAVWAVNQLRMKDPLGYQALVALADEQLADFEYRHIVVEDQLAGPGLEQAFRTAGWKIERELLMGLSSAPDRPANVGVVDEAEEDEWLEVMARWYGEDPDLGTDALAQLLAHSRRDARANRDRLLGVRSGDGRLVAITKLRGDGSTAQVEDVYTVPEARGRGYARALVSRAGELARVEGHDLIFIVADDEGWPKQLYERIGFRPMGRVWQFHRG
ncbi:MAG: GNAT family N-acetyltransferase [Solirubrobacterales bacterium]|nr:GNAT family N-acetyltransferase [Solirubrobacterales bacterium]